MLQSEFIRSLHCNYERILLDKKPEEKKYQYCMINRGGIKGLLPCSLRYINGLAYLYYDITSKQSVKQLFHTRNITREWLKDFLWGLKQLQMELDRFLLQEQNIIWYPDQIFQNLETNLFSFLYIPYYEGENSFIKLLDFLVEHIDYEDEGLVECVYKMYEQYEQNGDVYLQEQVFVDSKGLCCNDVIQTMEKKVDYVEPKADDLPEEVHSSENQDSKKSLRFIWESKRKKDSRLRKEYLHAIQHDTLEEEKKNNFKGVAEESHYDEEECRYEEYGNTIYIEESQEEIKKQHRLFTAEGELVAQILDTPFTIGKRKTDVTCCLEDMSVSRLHARIVKEGEKIYLEDLNSTNGTYKNGLRLQPYEKRLLEEGDEIKLGKRLLIYK